MSKALEIQTGADTEEPVEGEGDASQESAQGSRFDGSVTLDMDEGSEADDGQEGTEDSEEGAESTLPEGFESQEEYDQFVADAVAKRNASKGAKTPKADEKTTDQQEAQKVIDGAGLDMAALSKEWDENGGRLTDATAKALAAKGITSHMIANYAKGKAADSSKYMSDLSAFAGGEKQLKQMFQWASQNWDAEQIAGANEALKSGKMGAAKLALKALMNDFKESQGTTGDFISAGAPQVRGDSSKVKAFENNEDVVKAMSDPRYKTSESYRKQVTARLRKSRL